jgi:hypothetical protein
VEARRAATRKGGTRRCVLVLVLELELELELLLELPLIVDERGEKVENEVMFSRSSGGMRVDTLWSAMSANLHHTLRPTMY